MLLYAGTAVCISLGGAFTSIKQEEWDSWWWMQRCGWFLLQIGQVCNTVKAYYSNPNPKKEPE
jgi:hypothetical protein